MLVPNRLYVLAGIVLFLSLSLGSFSQCYLAWDSGTPEVNSPYCNTPNGSILVSASGQGNVTYTINGGGTQNTGLFENLSTGTYVITATDELDCEISLTVLLEGQESVEIESVIATPSECDSSTGTITILADGLGLRYALNNSNFQNENVFTGLSGGTYTVRVRDVNDCIEIQQVTVLQGSIELLGIEVVPTNCLENNGRIEVDASGNGLEYRLDGVTDWQSSPVFSGLPPGVYWVEIRDVEGCVLRRRRVIANNLSYSLQIENPLCGELYGSILIEVNSPGDYEYSIDGGVTYQDDNFFDQLPIGTYAIRIRLRGTNCFVRRNVTISEEPDFSIDVVSTTRPTCGQSDGSIIINTSGAEELTFDLSIDSVSISENNQSGEFYNLSQGVYTITISSSAGCALTRTVNLSDLNDISLLGVQSTPSSCIEPEGSITINASSSLGGELTYSLDGGPFYSEPFFDVLLAGPYTITIRSSTGCESDFLVTVPAANPIIVEEISTSIPSSVCTSDGEIIVLAEGVELEYSLDGENWQSSNVFTGLLSDIYIVYIRSLLTGCQTQTGDIMLEGNFYIEDIIITNTVCDRPEGAIEVYAVGIDMQYRVDDGEFQDSPIFTDLSVGEHILYVQDFYGCLIEQEFEILSEGNIVFTGYDIFHPECSDDNAAVTLFAEAETAIEYWREGQQPTTENTFYSLPLGVTTFFARSELGCVTSIDVIVNETSAIVNSATTEDYICFNQEGSITVSHIGGLPPFTYSMDNVNFQTSNTITGLREGIYTVYVRDREGCPSSLEAEVGYQCDPMVPNAISPDENEMNDRLVLLHERNIKINEFRVFNKWGELVYEKYNFWSLENTDEFWDGIDHQNQDGDQNVFLYEVIYVDIDGSVKSKMGTVHLIR